MQQAGDQAMGAECGTGHEGLAAPRMALQASQGLQLVLFVTCSCSDTDFVVAALLLRAAVTLTRYASGLQVHSRHLPVRHQTWPPLEMGLPALLRPRQHPLPACRPAVSKQAVLLNSPQRLSKLAPRSPQLEAQVHCSRPSPPSQSGALARKASSAPSPPPSQPHPARRNLPPL